jgi:hypothetical protein
MTVKVDEPPALGVPLMTPPELIESPAGNEPDVSAKLTDPVAPVAETVWLYAVLCVPFGSVVGVSVSAPVVPILMV